MMQEGVNSSRLLELLKRGAAEIFIHEAAIVLLARHGLWLEHRGFRQFIKIDHERGYASVNFEEALSALDAGDLDPGTGDWCDDDEATKILRIAASLSGRYAIYLREVMEGISRTNIGYVAEALMYADGFLSSIADPRP